ncbi:MAG: quinate 5-dehydrogenase [bacterium]
MQRARHVVSVSLGSSRGDHRVETELLGQQFIIERIGTNGDYKAFCQKLRELDGKVDAIGLGGINLALVAGGRRYYIRDAVRAVQGMRTPVVDGSGVKESWERHIITKVLPDEVGLSIRGRRVLLVAAVDRYSMAEAFVQAGANVVFGDFMFGLGIPIALRGLTTIKVLAALLLPVLTRLPYTWLYPTGSKQEQVTPKFGRAYRWAEMIAGDYHYIQRHMPEDLSGKTILTQTITPADLDDLRRRRLALLVTTTPEMDGRSFATNLIQATLVALSGRRPEDLGAEDYLELIRRVGFRPRVERLTPTA